jgi:adenine-specific DNA-methyltransferase
MSRKQRLELTWIGKDDRPCLEPRILIEDPEKSYHATQRLTDNDIFDNRLIFGDNLLALKALAQEYAGKIKCIFIDPPYNTGSAFQQYDDGVEHSIWLSLMRDRLELLHHLLTNDGSFWITLDDNEAHYFKVMADEIFGRLNFLSSVIWEKSDSPKMDSEFFSYRHDFLMVYAKDRSLFKMSRIQEASEDIPSHFNKVDLDNRRYYLKPLRAMGSGDDTREARPTLYFSIESPDGIKIYPKRQDGVDGRWRWSEDRVQKDKHLIEWVKGRDGWSPYYRIYADNSKGRPPETIWTHNDVGSNRTSKAEIKAIFPNENPFTTPKPEKLLSRVLQIATQKGDLVLDSFAGSGTTGAVAHKMGRRWIMIELGEHCHTHIIPRLKKVINGDDKGGITEATNWQGGGGFRYFKLAPSLLEKDQWGNWVISKQYNPVMLAEAMCKLMGFTYAPSDTHYWMQGHSSERDFIYTTTTTLTHDQLRLISEEVGEDRSLLICCKAFRAKTEEFANLTVKKIPRTVLSKCEWGKDDYSLKVENLKPIENLTQSIDKQLSLLGEDTSETITPTASKKRKRSRNQ